jgi:hypothetical protein
MKKDVKKLIGWADHMTGGTMSAEELEKALRNLAHREPKDLESTAREYRKRNRASRLRLIEVYIFENTAFELA